MCYRLTLNFTNTNKVVLEFIQERYCGHIRDHSPETEKKNRAYRLSLVNRCAERLLKDISPFLIVKEEEARVALDFIKTKAPISGRKAHPPEYVASREEYRVKLRDMKPRNIKAARSKNGSI